MKIYTTAQMIPQVFNGEVFECITEPYKGMRVKSDGKFIVQYCNGQIKPKEIVLSEMFWNIQWVKVVKVRRQLMGKKRILMYEMCCSVCDKDAISDDSKSSDTWNIFPMTCDCGGRINIQFDKPYYLDSKGDKI